VTTAACVTSTAATARYAAACVTSATAAM
jgi:hypothetical protein